jgi:hypothetical protein
MLGDLADLNWREGRNGKDNRMKLSLITKFLGSDSASALPETI